MVKTPGDEVRGVYFIEKSSLSPSLKTIYKFSLKDMYFFKVLFSELEN